MNDKPLIFLQFNSPWELDPGTIRLPRLPGLSAEDAYRRLKSGELTCPFILETDSERHLHFSHQAVQSTMRLNDPDALICAYTRKMMAFLLFNPEPRHIIMIGLGGGSIPKFCYRYLKQTQITVVEIDANVIALRDEFCVPANDERFRVVHDDGAHYMSTLPALVDVILVDAFDEDGIAPSLASSAFYGEAAASLTRDGVMVMNMTGEYSRHAAHIELIRESFGKHVVCVPVNYGDNTVLFAFKRRMKMLATGELEKRAQQLQSKLLLEFPRFLRRLCQAYTLA